MPAADGLLCRKWTQFAFNQLADRYPWYFQYLWALLAIRAERTITVGVTQDDATVTSAALFVSTDLNRQLRIGTGPTYTIATFTSTSSIELDQPYGDATNASASADIGDYYARMPANFGSFESVVDLSVPRAIRFGRGQGDLALLDPQRQRTGDPEWLIDLDVDSGGRVRYEWWPRLTTARQLPYRYKRRPQVFLDDDNLPGVLRDRPDVLVLGALAWAAGWPGTITQRNPYFSIALRQQHLKEFEAAIQSLGLRDDDQATQSFSDLPWHLFSRTGLSDASVLRATDATLDDYV